MHLESFGLTDRGRRRRRNEDAILFPPTVWCFSGEPYHLLAVADGVGGGPAGQLASSAAVAGLPKALGNQRTLRPGDALRAAVEAVNAEVFKQACGEGPQGMATTLVGALMGRGELWIANVGDSRAYLVSQRNVRQLTEDHTWVADRVRAGQMTEKQAASSMTRHVITRSVGAEAAVKVDLFGPERLAPSHVVVLCSDGLYSLVSDAEIGAVCSEMPPVDAAPRLIDMANQRGGPDNISVIVARWRTDESEPA